jgi:hypothetical protein
LLDTKKRTREEEEDAGTMKRQKLEKGVTDDGYITTLLLACPELGEDKDLLEVCHKRWQAADEKKFDLDLLTDGKTKEVPYVSAQDPSQVGDRFQYEDTESCVTAMCRSKLTDITTAFDTSKFKKFFVWGNKGTGKSHLVNAFACLKFTEHVNDATKPRVLFIPNLGAFAEKAATYLFEALAMAFLDSLDDLAQLKNLSKEDKPFEKLMEFTKNKDMILVADNHNALKPPSKSPPKDADVVANFVSTFHNYGQHHRTLFCASANQHSVKLATDTQDSTHKVFVFGGCARGELIALMTNKYSFIAKLRGDFETLTETDDGFEAAQRKVVNWDTVMTQTGGVAMDANKMLEGYAKMVNNSEEGNVEVDFEEHAANWAAKKAAVIKSHIKTHVINPTQNNALEEGNVFAFLKAGAFSDELTETALSDNVDCSFFYPHLENDGQLDWRTLHPVSDIVRRVAIELWLEHQNQTSPQDWKTTLLALFTGRNINPSTTGFIDELISLTILEKCMWTITYSGQSHEVKIASKHDFGGQHTATTSTKLPHLATWLSTVDEGKALQLNPLLWNYARADSVVLLKLKDGKLVLIEIQVTYTDPSKTKKKATNTAKFFTTDQWKSFVPDPNVPVNKLEKVLLWICPESCSVPSDSPPAFAQAKMMSFGDVFQLGGLVYAKPQFPK